MILCAFSTKVRPIILLIAWIALCGPAEAGAGGTSHADAERFDTLLRQYASEFAANPKSKKSESLGESLIMLTPAAPDLLVAKLKSGKGLSRDIQVGTLSLLRRGWKDFDGNSKKDIQDAALPFAKDSDSLVRYHAIALHFKFPQTDQAINVFIGALDDFATPEGQSNPLAVQGILGLRAGRNPIDDAVAAKIEKLLDSENPAVRRFAASELIAMVPIGKKKDALANEYLLRVRDGKGDVPALIGALRRVPERAPDILDMLSDIVQNDRSEIQWRVAAASAMSDLTGARARCERVLVKALVALDNTDFSVVAINTMVRWQSLQKDSREMIEQWAAKQGSAVRSLAADMLRKTKND